MRRSTVLSLPLQLVFSGLSKLMATLALNISLVPYLLGGCVCLSAAYLYIMFIMKDDKV